MTLERLAAGTLLVGFDGTRADEIRETFASAEFAGYLLFARNIENLPQVRALTDALRELHHGGLAPLLAVDQEGGRVARMQTDVEVLPPMLALGATDDSELAYEAGFQVAFDLRRAGFSLNFAPVLDLAVEAANTVIGTRSFGCDPERVAKLADAFARGLVDGGIVPTLKHFPGHGSTVVDSHLALPAIDATQKCFRARDLAPFAQLAPHAAAIMTAHIVVRALDPRAPATLSRIVLTDILRGELHFDGVCFTDCMQMDAIARGIGTVEGVVAAIAAGADCALVSADPQLARAAVTALVLAVENGTLARDRLQEAYARVARLRKSLARPLPLDELAPFPGIGRAIARRAVTAVRGAACVDAATAIVVSFEGETREGAQGLHSDHVSLLTFAPTLRELRLPLDPGPEALAHLLEDLESSGRRAIILTRRAHTYPAQVRAITAVLSAQPDALLVALREPYDLSFFPQARNAVAAYGDDAASLAGLSDVIFGNGIARGVLPVPIA